MIGDTNKHSVFRSRQQSFPINSCFSFSNVFSETRQKLDRIFLLLIFIDKFQLVSAKETSKCV